MELLCIGMVVVGAALVIASFSRGKLKEDND